MMYEFLLLVCCIETATPQPCLAEPYAILGACSSISTATNNAFFIEVFLDLVLSCRTVKKGLELYEVKFEIPSEKSGLERLKSYQMPLCLAKSS